MKRKVFAAFCCILLLAACSSFSGSEFVFTFSSKTPSSMSSSKTMYVNEDTDTVELNAALRLDGESVRLIIADAGTGQTVWEETYAQDTDFIIWLYDIPAGTEYTVTLKGERVQSVNLRLTSETKLVQEPEKPDKPAILSLPDSLSI